MLLLSVFSYSQNKNVIQELSDSINDTKEQVQELRNCISLMRDEQSLNARIGSIEKRIDKSGYYLKQSSILQYSALGCAAVSATFFLVSSKCEARLNQNGEVIDYGDRDAWRFGGYAAAAAGIMCEVCAIHFKLKAGKNLMLQPTYAGLTASLTF